MFLKFILGTTELQQSPKLHYIWSISKSTVLHFSIKYKFGTKLLFQLPQAVFMNRFYFSVLKIDHFWSFHAFSKKWKLKEVIFREFGKIINRLFHALAQFLFTTCKKEQDYYHQKVNVQLPLTLLNNLRLTILGS